MTKEEALAILDEYSHGPGQNYLIGQAAFLGAMEELDELNLEQISVINLLSHRSAMRVSRVSTDAVSAVEKLIAAINQFGDSLGINR